MFLTILDLFLCQIMEYSLTLCFASVIWKSEKKAKKKQKNVENAAVVVMTQNSSRPKELCHRQQLNVATELKHNSMAEREILS